MTDDDVLRTFIGIPLVGPGREALIAAQEAMRKGVRDGRAVKWERHENMHMTVQFLGDTSRGSPAAIAEALERAVRGHEPFTAGLGPPGAFGGKRPRVLVVGASEGSQRLVALHDEVARELSLIGYEPDPRPFNPHITIGRVRRGKKLDRALVEKLAAETKDLTMGAALEITELVHFRSELSPTGATYTRLATITLKRPGPTASPATTRA